MSLSLGIPCRGVSYDQDKHVFVVISAFESVDINWGLLVVHIQWYLIQLVSKLCDGFLLDEFSESELLLFSRMGCRPGYLITGERTVMSILMTFPRR